MKKCRQSGIGIMALVLATLFSGWAMAGDLEPPTDAVDGSGDPVSTMVTLDEIHSLVENINALVDPEPYGPCDPTGAGVEKTGQTTSYATGDDGDLGTGIAWPSPRFTNNGDGTVTDNLTGLVWLQDADRNEGTMSWGDALDYCNNLAENGSDLTDGSAAGDWRLPNVKELQSLIDYGNYNPVLPSGHPFIGVQSDRYWSGSTSASPSRGAWFVYLFSGYVSYYDKADNYYVWPVRDDN